jgi:integrase
MAAGVSQKVSQVLVIAVNQRVGQQVIEMPARPAPEGKKERTVPCRQEVIDALPPGEYAVEGVPGLLVRIGKRGATYRLQRRIDGRLVRRNLGMLTAAQAKRMALKVWAQLKPPAPDGKITLGEAWQRYLEEKPLAPGTRRLYEYTLGKYLPDWQGRSLEQIGQDRAGVRGLYLMLARKHGKALASLVLRQFRAVYNYHRRVNPELPECPTIAVDIAPVKPRDWALSDDELRAWWAGVQRLRPLKQVLWQVMLLTGARRGSVEALRWRDVDVERKLIHFSTAKAGRTYSVPACARLVELLRWWREQCAPDAQWVFESPRKPGRHIIAARDDKRGVVSAHHLRHTYRTTLAQLGCPPDSARLLLGHSLSGDVSRGYITAGLVTESLRPWAEAVAGRYAEVLGWSNKLS